MEFNIRNATEEDINVIILLWEEFRKYHDSNFLNKSKYKMHIESKEDAKELFKKYIIDNIQKKDAQVSIAFSNNIPIGYSLIFLKPTVPIFKEEMTGHFGDLFVKEEFHGKGVASNFKKLSLEWFKEKGVKILSIQVYNDNLKAREIYKKWGFFDYHIEMRREL